MATERTDIELLLSSGSENPKRIFAALNAEPTKPIKDVAFTPEEAHAFIRARYEGLPNSAIEGAIGFLNSEPGIKQRELSKEFSRLVSQVLSGSTLVPNASIERAEKVRNFFNAAGTLDALESIPVGPNPAARQTVYDFAVNFYAERLSDEELDNLVAYYTSPNGRSAVNGALGLTKDILKQYGI